ncbi:MAG: RluA family pseudouridine synthase [Clostridia bacterium]|nr:RluA family pseudouridine synthase [Clostridia bacterium]
MNEVRYNLIVEEAGERIDLFIANNLEGPSRSFVQKLIADGFVLLNGEKISSKKEKLKEGDEIEILIPEPEELKIEPEDIPLDIVYEDEDVLVVNKPRGMVVHPAVGNYQGTLVNAIMYHCKDRLSSINGVIRPGIVHRIDKDTSGLLMIAKNDMAHESLSAQLKEHSITRTYVALVHNNITSDKGVISEPIGRDPKNRLRMAVTSVGSKPAVTHYEVLERFGQYTLVKCNLETGRTHQIRVHMAYIKHPLVGDLVYGPKKSKINVEGQLLHAKVIGFKHPRTGEYMEFSSEIPEVFSQVLDRLRKEK